MRRIISGLLMVCCAICNNWGLEFICCIICWRFPPPAPANAAKGLTAAPVACPAAGGLAVGAAQGFGRGSAFSDGGGGGASDAGAEELFPPNQEKPINQSNNQPTRWKVELPNSYSIHQSINQSIDRRDETFNWMNNNQSINRSNVGRRKTIPITH